MRLNFLTHLFTELLDAPDAGTGGGAGTPAAGTPASGTPAATPSGTPASGTPAAAAATPASTSAPKQFSYTEDRSDWIPRHRLNETSGKLQSLQQQIADRDAKIAALAGVTPQDPNAANTQKVRDAFIQHFPHLKALIEMTPEQIGALTRMPDVAGRVQSAEQKQWQRVGTQVANTIAKDVAEAMGVDTLNDKQKADLRVSFGSWFKTRVQAELQTSMRNTGREISETLQRYEDGDEALLKEFTKSYTDNWVEPLRRSATAQTAGRIKPVPNSGGRSQVTQVQRPEKFASLDERLEYAAKLAAERGVQFGR